MDREISKEVQRKEQRKQFIRIGTAVGGFIVLIVVVISMLQTSLKRKDLNISTVDKGVIEVSVSASGKVIPAFEEIINSPINSRIMEVYKRGGDSVDVGTPILKLDLQSAETEYNKQLDEEQMKSLQLEQQRVTNHNKLSEMEMNLKVSRMELDRKAVELRNERYLDSLGAGTTDKVRQVELDYNVSILKLKEDEQKYKNEQALAEADLKVKELELNIFRKSISETRHTLEQKEKKDNVVTFEELGVDHLYVDEAHSYKNAFLYTKMRNVAGIAQNEAQKSADMFNKCQYLDEITGGKGITFATGTPISNSMTELYVMQRYLQNSKLQNMGLGLFDSWASTFGEVVTSIELAPEGYTFIGR